MYDGYNVRRVTYYRHKSGLTSIGSSGTLENMDTLDYTIILHPEPEGGFTVSVPSLPGCITYGQTLDEAKRMATDAIRGYLVSL